MIKGVIFCVCFLVVQLMVLSHIDNRLSPSSKEARQVVTSTTAVQRKDEDDSHQA